MELDTKCDEERDIIFVHEKNQSIKECLVQDLVSNKP